MAKTQHVVPKNTGGWDVKKGGSEKATKHFETKQPAVDYARDLAKKAGSRAGGSQKGWNDRQEGFLWE